MEMVSVVACWKWATGFMCELVPVAGIVVAVRNDGFEEVGVLSVSHPIGGVTLVACDDSSAVVAPIYDSASP